MVTITEFSDDVVGSLSGLGQVTGRMAARTPVMQTAAGVKAEMPLITRDRPELDRATAPTAAQQQLLLPPAEMIIDGGPHLPGVTTYKSGGGFIDNLMAAVKANPAIFAAGAALLVVGAIILLPRLAAMRAGGVKLAPVQTMGLGAGPKKKRAKRKGPTHVCAAPGCTKGIRGDAEFCSKHKQ